MTGHGHTNTGVVFGLVPAAYCYAELGWQYAALSFALCVLFSTAPDWLEIQVTKEVEVNRAEKKTIEPRVSTLIPHRTVTHIVSVWTLIGVIGVHSINPFNFPYSEHIPTVGYDTIAACLIGISAGGLIHLIWDIPNKKPVPVFTLFDRVGLGLWKSGKYENAIVTITLLPSIAAAAYIIAPDIIIKYYNLIMKGL